MEQEVINIHSKMKFNIDDLKVIANNIINELELMCMMKELILI